MTLDLGSLNPQEVVVLTVAVAGLIPVLLYRSRLHALHEAAYGFLLLGAVATNVENLLWHDAVNLVEHGVGNMGAGLAVAALAVLHRRRRHQMDDREQKEVNRDDDD